MTHATRAAANKTLLSEQPRKNVCVFLMCRMIWLTWPLQWINSDLTQHLALGRWNSNVEEHFHVVITAEECFASYGEAGRSSLNTDLFEGNPAQECMFLSQSTVGHEDRVDHKSIYWRSEEIRNMRKTKSLSYMIILGDSLLSLSLSVFFWSHLKDPTRIAGKTWSPHFTRRCMSIMESWWPWSQLIKSEIGVLCRYCVVLPWISLQYFQYFQCHICHIWTMSHVLTFPGPPHLLFFSS